MVKNPNTKLIVIIDFVFLSKSYKIFKVSFLYFNINTNKRITK